jgi:erythromycin esterase
MYLCSSRLLQQMFAGAMIFLCLLVLMSTGLVGCGQPTPLPAPNLKAVKSWITQSAIPLKTVNPQGPLDDLQPLRQIVGNASIVGLGEATHGAHEFFTMKHRLLEFLVEKMGFTMFSLEGSWSAGEQMNRYVLTGQGDAGAALQQFHFSIWNTQEMLALVKWVRAYNADPRHMQKVYFTGFDCQVIEAVTFDQVTQYLKTVDPQSVARVASLYQVIPLDPASYTLPLSLKQQYALNARQVYELLKQHEMEYEAHLSIQAFAQTLQEARVIVQYTQLLITYNLNDPQSMARYDQERDAFMAENIVWLHEHGAGGGKMVLWAHNVHIGTLEASMGMHLREHYQALYLPLGFSFYQGSFNAFGVTDNGQSTDRQDFTIRAPSTDSSNYTLGSVHVSLYILDLRTAPGGPVSQWLDEPHRFLMISAGYSDKYQSKYYTPLSLWKSFDVIIHIQKITASQPIPLEV